MVCKKLSEFLSQFPKTGNGKHTHTMYGGEAGGSYTIPNEHLEDLYKLITKAIFKKNHHVTMVEKVQDTCRLVIDLDFKYKETLQERQYNEEIIKTLISYVFTNIDELYGVADEQKQCFVMEKSSCMKATQKAYSTKDGIHLLFPYIVAEKETYKTLREKLLTIDIDELFTEEGFTPPSNSVDEVIDLNIYKGGNWFVYGCGKPNETDTYRLTSIYKDNGGSLLNLPTDLYLDNPLEIMKLNSVSLQESNVSYTEVLSNGVKEKPMKSSLSVESLETMEYNDPSLVISKTQKFNIDIAKKLTECLSTQRASDCKMWNEVGYCLHSINPSTMLPSWIGFSKKWAMYMNDEECKKQWEYMNCNNRKEYTIATLHYWAKQDNPEMYTGVMKDALKPLIDISIRGEKTTGPHSDVANVIFHYFKDSFRCGNIKENTWYYFNESLGGKWELTEEGHLLRKELSHAIVDLYMYYQKEYQDIANQEEEESERQLIYNGRVTNISKVIIKLKDSGYKDKIMKECKEFFYDKDFMEKLNDKKHLLGFENGVYDLQKSIFREGLPDDYVSLTTGIPLPIIKSALPICIDDIIEISKEIPNYKRRMAELDDFLKKVFPIEAVREYTLRFLSSCLSGEIREEKFYFWTGSGGNGKSKLVELLDLAFGDYSRTMDVAFLTTKRGSSSSASPELESIKNARFVTMSEPEKTDQIYVGKLKQMTGGDKMTTRGLFKETTQFKPQFKIVLMCNDLPQLNGNDGGIWRRIEVVKYISKFTDDPRPSPADPHQYIADEQLSAKLEEWKLLFMIKLLEKYPVYDKEGTKPPMEVKDETKSYKTSNDIIANWMDDMIEETEEFTSFDELYDDWETWCDDEGYQTRQRPDKREVKQALLRAQEKTTYGLVLGKTLKDKCANGTKSKPRFNLRPIDE